MNKLTVYLAGGMKSDWHERVSSRLPGFIFYNPKLHNLKDAQQYTIWDLFFVRRAEYRHDCYHEWYISLAESKSTIHLERNFDPVITDSQLEELLKEQPQTVAV
jgi:hypothetical protein